MQREGIESNRCPASRYNKIVSAMRYSALADSKCIRAGLVFASGNLNNEISNSALIDMATSIELMHTYSLIHDDLPSMDNDDMRRGQASNHLNTMKLQLF